MRLSVQGRLYGAFGIAAVLLLLVATIAYISLSSVASKTANVQNAAELDDAVMSMVHALHDGMEVEANAIFSGTSSEATLADFQTTVDAFHDSLATLEERGNEGIQTRLAEADEAHGAFQDAILASLALVKDGDTAGAIQNNLTVTASAFKAADEALWSIENDIEASGDAGLISANSMRARSIKMVVAISAIAVVAASVLAVVISRSIAGVAAAGDTSEERFRGLVEAIPDLMFRVSSDGTLLDFHQGAADSAVPLEGVRGRRLADVMPAEIAKGATSAIAAVMESGEPQTLELQFESSDGLHYWESYFVKATDDEVIAIARDVTVQQRLREQLTVAQKSEALATLVAGVAHDFNNLLTAIGGSLHMAGEDPERSEHWLANATDATDRASGLVQQLLLYARHEEPHRSTVDVAQVVQQTVTLARETFDRRIQLDVRTTAPFGAYVLADSAQLHQVLMNLLLNARDAVLECFEEADRAEYCEPRIEVCVERRVVGRDRERVIEIVVEDNGSGMDQSTRERIFDPFFTTKEVGKGTGLGLSTVYGIVKGHGGRIIVNSAPGRGAKFIVRLPADSSNLTSSAAEDGDGVADRRPARGGRVLLVDDEELLRQLGGAVLQQAGYDVTAASDGAEALRQLSSTAYDLVVLDVNMPVLNGWQVLDQLSRDEQSPPVLIVSGLATEDEALSRGAVGLLAKPFNAETMLQAVWAATHD